MHDHDHDPEVPQEVLDEYESIWEQLKVLDPELRNLFINEAVLKIKDMLGAAIAEDNPLKSKSMLAIAENSMNLIGMVNATNSDDREDWTSTGDKRVSKIWNDWIHLVVGMVKSASFFGEGTVPINAEDLPPETIERLSNGNPTADDLELVKAAMRKSGAEIPDGVDVEFGGIVGTKEEAMALAKGFAEKGEPDEGYGLYL